MPMSPFARSMASFRAPVKISTPEKGYQEKTRRVQIGPRQVVQWGTPEYTRVMKQWPTPDRTNTPPINPGNAVQMFPGMQARYFYTPDYTYEYQAPSQGRGTDFSSSERLYRTRIREEKYLEPLSKLVKKQYETIAQRLPYAKSRNLGGIASILGGLREGWTNAE